MRGTLATVSLRDVRKAVNMRTTGVVAVVAETRTTPFVDAVPADYGRQGRRYVCRA
jgi:hypothetical protein